MPQDALKPGTETWETQAASGSHRPMTSQALVPRWAE